ncbi:MAG: hypoxanthine phosphoribosyltransferase [Chloroflexi bacterium]|nr:hypoxanthine phosphoribosyltransferase [Chloroflexota bacterium]
MTVLLSRQQIAEAVARLAPEIRQDYTPALGPGSGGPRVKAGAGEELLVLGVLRGAFVFMADLVRALNMPLTVDFVRVSTYGGGTVTNRKPRIVQGPRTSVLGRRVLVVEDIVDTGITSAFLVDYLKRKGAASVKLCALLSKPSRREADVEVNYLGFTIADLFVVGYGLDYAQQYRYLPDICVLETK